MPKLYENKQERMTFFLLAIYSAMVFMFDADEKNVILIHVVYGLICLNFLIRTKAIRICTESTFLLLYLIFSALSVLWAEDADNSIIRLRAVFLLIVFLFLATSYALMTGRPYIIIIIALVLGALALTVYMFSLYGVSGILQAINDGENRLGSLINNVNAVGNSLSVGAVALIGVVIFSRKKWAFLLMIPLGICILAAGSRTSVISLLTGGVVLFLCYSLVKRDLVSGIKRLFVFFLIITVVWIVIRNIPATRELVLRIENALAIFRGDESAIKESSAQTRMDFIELGWKKFLESPLVGNGIGNAGYAMQEKYGSVTYLHNNYVEILASGGIIGFFLFYTPYFLVLKKHIQKIFIQKENDPVIIISFALLCARLVGHFGIVVYYSKIEFILLALWITVANLTPSVSETDSPISGHSQVR